MLRSHVTLGIACALGVSLLACDMGLYFNGFQWVSPTLEVEGGELQGDFGDRTLESPRRATVEGFTSRQADWVEVLVADDDGASMALLTFEGGVDAYPVGTRRSYVSAGVFPAPVTALGCTGRVPYAWDIDADAREVTLVVVEHPTDPGLARFEFTAEFDDGTLLEGSFDVARE